MKMKSVYSLLYPMDRHFFALLLFFLLPVRTTASEVVAVLSSDLDAYREALDGFTNTFGGSPSVTILASKTLPPVKSDTRLIVAFGGRAAAYSYPKNTPLIYCLSPGTIIDPAERDAATVKIEMMPSPEVLSNRIALLSPPSGKIAVLWIADVFSGYVADLTKRSTTNLAFVSKRMTSSDRLPETLREIHTQAQSIWLLPDPNLIKQDCFATLKQFSLSNKIPLYVPTTTLVQKGAMGAVVISFHDIGVTAGQTAHQLMKGANVPPVVFPSNTQIHVNMETANLISPENAQAIQKNADKVYP